MNKGLIFLLIFTVLVPVQAQLIHTDPLQPQLNGEARWRVGYYQGGPLNSYQVTLQYFIRALIEKSWLPYQELPEPLNSLETRSLWEWLSTTAHSPYIEFVEDAYYDLNWDSDNRPIIRQQIIDRLQNQRDLNLMLAFGTWAGQDLANGGFQAVHIVLWMLAKQVGGCVAVFPCGPARVIIHIGGDFCPVCRINQDRPHRVCAVVHAEYQSFFHDQLACK